MLSHTLRINVLTTRTHRARECILPPTNRCSISGAHKTKNILVKFPLNKRIGCTTLVSSSKHDLILKKYYKSSLNINSKIYTRGNNDRVPKLSFQLSESKFNGRFYSSPSTHLSKTIYALSTPWGVSGISVIRISGPKSSLVLEKMTKKKNIDSTVSSLPTPRTAQVRKIIVPKCEIEGSRHDRVLEAGEEIDEGMVLWFEGPKSATGEDLVELHLHGSISVIRDTLDSLKLLGSDFVEAQPGDFTKRAWYNGKIQDLTRLEAVADLIHAETRHQRKLALDQMQGSLGNLYDNFSKEIYTSLAHIEALVDFGHDELLESPHILSNCRARISVLIETLKTHLNDNKRGEVLRNGVTVCLIGRPNAGKSSLMNALSKTDAAIVSPLAGTTRDVIETRLDLSGFPLILQDTAGIQEDIHTVGLVEKEGILRAISRFKNANLKLLIVDVTDPSASQDPEIYSMIKSDPSNTIIVLNKVDKIMNEPTSQMSKENSSNHQVLNLNESVPLQAIPSFIKNDPILSKLPMVCVSCTEGTGMGNLMNHLEKTLKAFFSNLSGDSATSHTAPALTRRRHRQHLMECLEALHRYMEIPDEQVELAAEELRLAGKSIARITGHVDVEQILDIVFKDFCIGK